MSLADSYAGAAAGAILAALGPGLAGCLVTAAYDDTSFLCVESPLCPDGFECRDGRCRREGAAADAAPTAADGTPDTADAAGDCGDGLCEAGEDCATCPADCGACDPNLALRWTFDDLAGGIAYDASSLGHHGLLEGGRAGAGAGGPALALDELGEHVVLADADPVLKPGQQVAVTAWIEATETDVSGGEVASMGDSYALRLQADGNVYFFVWDGIEWEAVETVGAGLLDGAPHHIVGQHTGTALEIYLDGELAIARDFEGTILYDLGTDFFVGRHGDGAEGRQFYGLVDDVEVFTVALTPEDIATLATR